MKLEERSVNKFWIEDPYSSNPKVYQYPVDGIDDGALVVVELDPVLKMMDEMSDWLNSLNFHSPDCLDRYESRKENECCECGASAVDDVLKKYKSFKKSLK